jgi:hypothetical protein
MATFSCNRLARRLENSRLLEQVHKCILRGKIKKGELRGELIEAICDATAQKRMEEG